jgi:hypothetical protein
MFPLFLCIPKPSCVQFPFVSEDVRDFLPLPTEVCIGYLVLTEVRVGPARFSYRPEGFGADSQICMSLDRDLCVYSLVASPGGVKQLVQEPCALLHA